MNRAKKIIPAIFISSLLSFNLTGCSWFSSDSSTKITQNMPKELKPIQNEISASKLWQTVVGTSSNFYLTPAYNELNNQVLTVNADGDLSSINKDTGQKNWIINTKEQISAGVAVGDDIVLIGSIKGKAIAFDYNGQKKWDTQLSAEVLGVPVISQGTALVRTADNAIYALDVADGKIKWTYRKPVLPSLTLRNQASLLALRGAVFAGFSGGKVVAMMLENGNIGWDSNVSLPKGVSEIERINDITSVPIADEERACAVAYQGKLSCFDLRSGSLLWSKEISSLNGLTQDQRLIYVVDAQSTIWALDKKSGSTIWKQTDLNYRNLSNPLVLNGYVIVGDSTGHIHWLRTEDGSFSGRLLTENSPINPTLKAINNNEFLLQNQTNSVFAIRF